MGEVWQQLKWNLTRDIFNKVNKKTWAGPGGEERPPRGTAELLRTAAIRQAQLPPGSPAPAHREWNHHTLAEWKTKAGGVYYHSVNLGIIYQQIIK